MNKKRLKRRLKGTVGWFCLIWFFVIVMEGLSVKETGVLPVKKRMRFREEDDLALLREVAGQNPFQNTEAWQIIQEHMILLTSKTFSIKTLKDHLDLLITIWLEKTKIMTYTSGTEEDFSEKEQLCQNIYDLMTQFRNKPKKKCTKAKASSVAGKASREMWAQNNFSLVSRNIEIDITDIPENIIETTDATFDHDYINNNFSNATDEVTDVPEQPISLPQDDVLNISMTSSLSKEKESNTPSLSRVNKTNANNPQPGKLLRPVRARKRKINAQRQGLSYLEQYDKAQFELRKEQQKIEERKLSLEEKKLELEERNIVLAEKKFSLEEYEKKKTLELMEQRLAADLENQNQMNHIIQRQENIIEMLIKQIQK